MKAIVIGGGIVGLCSAYYLNRSGWEVTVIDSGSLTDGCSHGNLGMIVPSHFVPLAAPGMISKGIRWMFNPQSPFYIRPSLNTELFRWGYRFFKSASVSNVERAALPLLQLHQYSQLLYKELAKEKGFDFGMEQRGILMYYKTNKTGDEEAELAEKAKHMGIDAAVLNASEVQELEPHTALDIAGAVHYRCDAHLYPNALVSQLVAYLERAGVIIEKNTRVHQLIVSGKRIQHIETDKGKRIADVIVLSAGSWLGSLAKTASLRIPVIPGKGYSFTGTGLEQGLEIPAILCEAKVAITPMNGFLRFGGTMEIGAMNDRVNMNRVKGIVTSVASYFPGMNLALPDKKDVWFGYRPCSPDGLPYLGRSKRIHNLIVAGGHAMMGLSLGAASGKVVAQIANENSPDVDICLFQPERFQV